MCAAVVINPNHPLCQLWCFTLARSGRSFPGVWCTLPIAVTTGPVCMGGSPGAASVPPSSPIQIRFQCRAGCFTRSSIGCCQCARVLARSPFPTTFASVDRWSTATGRSVTPCRPFSPPRWPKSLPSVYAETLRLLNLKLTIKLFFSKNPRGFKHFPPTFLAAEWKLSGKGAQSQNNKKHCNRKSSPRVFTSSASSHQQRLDRFFGPRMRPLLNIGRTVGRSISTPQHQLTQVAKRNSGG